MGERTGNDHGSLIKQVLDDGAGAARSALAASWRRSMTLHGLDPEDRGRAETLTETQLREARQAMEPMVRAAEGALDRLFLAVGETGCCVLLCDAEGVPVERRGAAADDDIFRRWGLWTGAVWSEAVEGTNAIGTALTERRPTTIHRDQHFHTRNTGLSCISHPLYDPWGRLVGVLDVSSARADHATELMLGLIAAEVVRLATDAEIAELRHKLQEMERAAAAGDRDAYYWGNVGFHERFAEIAHNKTLQRILETLVLRSLRLRRLTLTQPDRMARSLADHMRLVGALEDRDAELASALIKANVLGALKLLEQLLADGDGKR